MMPLERYLWPNVRVDTFVSFAQFVYTGDYDVAPHKTDGKPTLTIVETKFKSEVEAQVNPEANSDSDSLSDSEAAVIIYGISVVTQDCKERIVTKESYSTVVLDTPLSESPKNKYILMVYSDILLGHARMYALATNIEHQGLQKLAFKNIKHVLLHYYLSSDEYWGWEDNVLELFKYAFSVRNYSAKKDDCLRKLVLNFVMKKIIGPDGAGP